jgi:hypothetical protein
LPARLISPGPSSSASRSRSKAAGSEPAPLRSLFISYGREDMVPVHWLNRLKLYLAPLDRSYRVEIWDDSRISPGAQWEAEIARALERCTAAILLIGPAFLASEFITTQELPILLAAAKEREIRIYPVVVAYCSYTRSILASYQAFNDPDAPLEALAPAEQNKRLNDVSAAVDNDLRHAAPGARAGASSNEDTGKALREIARQLKNTRTAFEAQCRVRDELYAAIRKRLGILETLQYERFFFRYYSRLNKEEKFQFKQVRAITEGPLHDGNTAILQVIERVPRVLDEVPSLLDLQQHVVFWLNKYQRVFAQDRQMCVLYTGVEDGVPFPRRAEKDVERWLKARFPKQRARPSSS